MASTGAAVAWLPDNMSCLHEHCSCIAEYLRKQSMKIDFFIVISLTKL